MSLKCFEGRVFVTKFVSSGPGHNETYIPQHVSDRIGYSTTMANGPHILVDDDLREIRDLVSRALS